MSEQLCLVTDCGKGRRGGIGGYCSTHTWRLRVWGNLHENPEPEWPEVEPITPDEEWRPVPGHEADYRVSSEGRILARRRPRAKGGIRKQQTGPRGYWHISLCANGVQGTYETHRLVAAAFLGPRPDGMHVRHIDGDKLNCRLSNLAYGTVSENAQDTIRHGHNPQLAKTHCPKGHPYSGDNLIIRKTLSGTNRKCRTCHYDDVRRRYERKRTAGPTINDLATFLLQHVEWIAAQPFADEPASHFHELTVQARSLAFPSGRRYFTIPNVTCRAPLWCDVASSEVTHCDGALVAVLMPDDDRENLSEITCDTCGLEVPLKAAALPGRWSAA